MTVTTRATDSWIIKRHRAFRPIAVNLANAACRRDLRGTLVLSEFAGAWHELHEAFICNPHDVEVSNRPSCVQSPPPRASDGLG